MTEPGRIASTIWRVISSGARLPNDRDMRTIDLFSLSGDVPTARARERDKRQPGYNMPRAGGATTMAYLVHLMRAWRGVRTFGGARMTAMGDLCHTEHID